MSHKIFEREAELIKVLSHPGRLEIIHLLRHHSLTVSQITQMLGERQAYVSQQLTTLKAARIVAAKRSGKEMYYELVDPRITVACDSLHSIVSSSSLSPSPEPTVTDPVCHMKLTPSRAHYTAEFAGVRQYFCGKGCHAEFTQLHKGAI